MTDLDIPDNIYNWLVSYFRGHSQCTKYDNLTSAFQEISAGIIQGSGIGPASFVFNSGDLQVVTLTLGNSLCNYAEDTYLIIPHRHLMWTPEWMRYLMSRRGHRPIT